MSKSGSPPAGPSINYTEVTDSQGYAEDNASSARATKNWKKIKEISEKEDKRPPWRMVSLSTLPEPDKNAILRAKLLDASRRMRLGKIPVATQTDNIPTKLMKEVNIDIQTDLIKTRDVEILTDGAITLRQEGAGEFLLTHSVAQMTDVVLATEAQTQTVTPRTTNKFFEDYFSRRIKLENGEEGEENLEHALSKNEKKLLQQIKEIRKIDDALNPKKSEDINRNESELSDDSLVDDDDDDEDEGAPRRPVKKFLRKKSYKRPKSFLKPTIPSWHFDMCDDNKGDLQLSQKNSRENNRPWSSFTDVEIDNKLANMKLVPIPARKMIVKKKSTTWSDGQHNAVADLINEANALLDMFEEMAILLGPDLKLNALPEKDTTKIKFLSEYWEPILRESAETLDRKMSTLKKLPVKKFEPISPEMLGKVL